MEHHRARANKADDREGSIDRAWSVATLCAADELVCQSTAFPGLPSRLRVRYGKWNQMESELYNWIMEVNMHFRYIKVGCSIAIICQKAQEIGKKNKIPGFSPSNGWFGRFRMRFDLVWYVLEIARFHA
jgi:hypothetical protein